jgi:hypothetical protein
VAASTAAPAEQTAAPTREATLAPATAAPTVEVAANTAAPVKTSAPTAPPATEAPAVPAELKSVSPFKIRRGQNLLDIRGTGLRADQQVMFVRQKGKGDIRVLRQKLADPTLLQVLVLADQTGLFAVALADAGGVATLSPVPVVLEVIQ